MGKPWTVGGGLQGEHPDILPVTESPTMLREQGMYIEPEKIHQVIILGY